MAWLSTLKTDNSLFVLFIILFIFLLKLSKLDLCLLYLMLQSPHHCIQIRRLSSTARCEVPEFPLDPAPAPALDDVLPLFVNNPYPRRKERPVQHAFER